MSCLFLYSTSTNTSKKQETVKKQTTGSFVDVCFHVIITPTILINPDKDFVVIAFGNYGGGWDSKKHKLKFERYVTFYMYFLESLL